MVRPSQGTQPFEWATIRQSSQVDLEERLQTVEASRKRLDTEQVCGKLDASFRTSDPADKIAERILDRRGIKEGRVVRGRIAFGISSYERSTILEHRCQVRPIHTQSVCRTPAIGEEGEERGTADSFGQTRGQMLGEVDTGAGDRES
jgi:hypothetical protein